MKIETNSIWLFLIIISIVGDVQADQEIPILTVYSSAYCGMSKQVLERINNPLELSQVLDVILSGEQPKPSIKIDVDYARQSLILFALGQKPSAGFNLMLDKNKAMIRAHKLYLPIRVFEPRAGSFQAQVMTSPCQIYVIPNADFTEILLENYSENQGIENQEISVD